MVIQIQTHKIIHVVEAFGAGTLSMVSAIANRQAQAGHVVTVIHSVREETPANWRALFDSRITFIQLPMIRAIQPVADWRAGRLLIAELRRIAPDVVHLHSSKAGALGRIVSLFLRGPRWFFSPHGLSFLQRAEGRLKNTAFLLIEKLLALVPVTLIACSPSEGEQIRAHLTRRVLVVNNAVDVAAIPMARMWTAPVHPSTGSGRTEDKTPFVVSSSNHEQIEATEPEIVRIGTVGRVALARNPELFASIAAALKSEGVEFVWIGGGNESGEATLNNAGVKVSGWIDRAQALQQLATLDIYIQTSRWEGLPVAVIEAMAAGLPVVATNVVGNRDLVVNGENGWLAEDRDDFIARLVPLIENRAERQRLGEKAKAFAHAHYSLDTMMAALDRAYGLKD